MLHSPAATSNELHHEGHEEHEEVFICGGRFRKMKHSHCSNDNLLQGPGHEQDFMERLQELCSAHGILMTDQQARLCYRHSHLMLQWNCRINLTRITCPDELLVKHLLDSTRLMSTRKSTNACANSVCSWISAAAWLVWSQKACWRCCLRALLL